jgi:hypothetical protein
MDGTALSSTTASTNRTFTLPFNVHSGLQGSFRVYRKEDQDADPRVTWGEEIPILSWPASNQITINDPLGEYGDNVWIGTTFTSLMTLSEIHLKEESNGAQVPNEEGRLTLKRISFLYYRSFYFRVEVTPYERSTRVYPVNPFQTGEDTALEDITSHSSRVSIPVNAENTKVDSISIINDSVVPHRIQSAEWVAQYSILSRRA